MSLIEERKKLDKVIFSSKTKDMSEISNFIEKQLEKMEND